MSRPSTSIAARAVWAAFASAVIAAAIAATAASAFAELLVLRQTDRHLMAVALELTRDLDNASDARAIANVVADEQGEVTSTGIRLAVYGAGPPALAGDSNVPFVDSDGCSTVRELRICSVLATGGSHVVAGTLRETSHALLASAALGAAALAGCVAWVIARVLSRRAVEPLVRLQARIANTSVDAMRVAEPRFVFGPDEGVSEVDDLRRALETLLARMRDAIDRSSHFAANAAHELRTPLTALRAELELMSEGAASKPSLDLALRKVAQLQTLTERLLVLAAPDGADVDGFEVVSLRDVVDEALGVLAAEDVARIALGDEDADVFVRGDSQALRMVVSNGLSNALKFGTRVRVELGTIDGVSFVAIEDDGPGVPERDRARMFEPFARGDSARRIPGHGLGLALVADVAHRHGGRAELKAAQHGAHGARLEVRLPLADS